MRVTANVLHVLGMLSAIDFNDEIFLSSRARHSVAIDKTKYSRHTTPFIA